MADQPKVSATFKAHAGYDAPWLVVEGADPGDLAQRLQAIEATGLPVLVGGVDAAMKAQFAASPIVDQSQPMAGQPAAPVNPYVTGGGTAASAGNADPWTTQAPAAGQQPTQPAAAPAQGPAPQCNHGSRQWVDKVSKSTGKPFKAWMCPQPQGATDKCDAIFVN